ncbi:MAG: EamA family transporter [Planctomycetes bacterium]|nr:EamA family transporter [Planctomycetota bacterium]
MLAITLAWGLSFVVVKDALLVCGPYTLTALRAGTGFVAAIVLLRPRLLTATRLEWSAGVLGGVLLAGGYLLQTIGLETADAGTSAFLTAGYIPLVPILQAAILRRPPGRRELIAVVVATTGLALICLRPGTLRLGAGEVLVGICGVFWAAQIVVCGRVAERVHVPTFAAIQIGVVCLLTGAALPFTTEAPVVWSGELVATVFFLGYVTCALAFAVQGWAQRKFAPTKIAILFSPEPVFAALAGWWFKDEEFPPRKFVGAAIVLLAVLLVLLPQGRRAGGTGAVS